MTDISRTLTRLAATLVAGLSLASTPVFAQDVERFDPDEVYTTVAPEAAIDADLIEQQTSQSNARPVAPVTTPTVASPAPTRTASARGPASRSTAAPIPVPATNRNTQVVTTSSAARNAAFDEEFADYSAQQPREVAPEWANPGTQQADDTSSYAANAQDASTYGEDDLIGAAEGVFGKGAEGLAKMIQGLLKEQGQPNGYIVGREAGGAFVFGARYGSGTLHHKIEGQRKVYWTGPSVGFDAGANAGNTFVLVYNLYDSEDLFERYPAGEGQAYLIGGLNASYLRKGDVVLIPIRVGAGVRLGINAGYLKFSKKQRWLPF